MDSSGSEGLKKVIVVGTGPAGLVLSLLLAKHGITVECLDMLDELDEQPRATHYGPPAVQVLTKAGVIDEIREQGLVPNGMCWRKPDGTMLANIESSLLADHPNRTACLPLNRMSKIVLKELERQATATLKWGHRVIDIGQDENEAWVVADTPAGKQKLAADLVIGCDGANSIIRRSLFGTEFPGFTWEKHMVVATNCYYDFARFGWSDANFIVDPQNYYMAARIQRNGMWRVSYGEVPGLSREEYIARQPGKFEAMLPGNPKPEDYVLTNISPYKVHQRLAPKMRVGRFVLAADAAHLCNPFGGLGLTGGLADIGSLYECLVGIHEGKASLDILDKYDEIRQQKFNQIINPVSIANLERMFADPNTVLEHDQGLQRVIEVGKDAESSRAFQLGSTALAHDFSQYFADTQTTGGSLDLHEKQEDMGTMSTRLAIPT